jgi:hypothetical protein
MSNANNTAAGGGPTETAPGRTEVQSHGFCWERDLLLNIYRISTDDLSKIKYTNKADLPSELNAIDNCDLSIKTTCNENVVCMADCLRVFDAVSSGTPLHLVVIHYKQNDLTNTKRIISIVEVDLTSSSDILFGTLTRADIEKLDNAVKSVPHKRKPTQEEHSMMYTIRNELQSRSGAIYFNIKCDSRQSRLQCSFNRFKEFLDAHPSRIVARSETNEFRGGVIQLEIPSSRRVFLKKQSN